MLFNVKQNCQKKSELKYVKKFYRTYKTNILHRDRYMTKAFSESDSNTYNTIRTILFPEAVTAHIFSLSERRWGKKSQHA